MNCNTEQKSISMSTLRGILIGLIPILALGWTPSEAQPTQPIADGTMIGISVDFAMVARIREEGLQRSQLSNTLSYMTDVLGARLTNSRDMERAQLWVIEEMKRIGLVNTEREPFMDYGASWDNEYVSLHLLEPDYQPMVGYPVAHTPGTAGKEELHVVIADVSTRQDLEKFRGTLGGKAVLSTPPPTINRDRFATGTPRRTDEEMRALEQDVMPPPPAKKY